MADRFSCMGKEILRDRQHFADAATPRIAEAVTLLLNRAVVMPDSVDADEFRMIVEVLSQ